MPGLIDNHTHLFMETSPVEELLSPNTSFEALFRKAQTNATEMLLRGFTTARDMAGPVFELKKAIDRGDGCHRTAHLAFGCDDLADRWTWRLPLPQRASQKTYYTAQSRGSAGCWCDRRWGG
ncbi:MAG: amidohydrolase family protein [Chroococcidiopsidaceae cyanobacterium CP_BM_RX_35]|nr:amidohydrolase family protein [Chroococcidiopsidaceae cyanobacterium CP_BM_RX_35]